MPVLSPHRGSVAGGYRTSLGRYPSSSVYAPSYCYERYTSRSYTDSDGRRVFSRSGSVTEDGKTTRFSEEFRENRRAGGDLIGPIRENAALEARRDPSATRGAAGDRSDRDRYNQLSVSDSLADLRSKYSPANYVPAVYRNRDPAAKVTSVAAGSPNSVNNRQQQHHNHHQHQKSWANNNSRPENNNSNSGSEGEGEGAQRPPPPVSELRKRFEGARDRNENSREPDASVNVVIDRSPPRKPDPAPVPEDDSEASRVTNFSSYIPSKTAAERLGKALPQRAPRGAPAADGRDDGGDVTADRSAAAATAMDRRASGGGGAGAAARRGLNGLKNIGNTCFMNSVIQCLSNTRPLLEYLRDDQYASETNTTISGMKGALIKAFAHVIKELWSEDSFDRVVNTVSLKSQIQRFAPRFMGYAQQDAQEFLRYLLEGLHEDVNRVTAKPAPIHAEIDEKLSDAEKSSESWQRYLRVDNSKIVDIFVGQLKSTLKCTHCGHCSVTFDPFWDLSLPIPQKVGPVRLQQCLDSFTREETLDGDEKPTCSRCKERRKCTKSFAIQKFPRILVIHLKRFSPTERFRGKLSVTVDFPLDGLDMSAYAASAAASRYPPRYALYAVSNHSGTTYSGHYTAHCRHPYSRAWHEYNDSRVSSISAKSVISGEAYVLFYELNESHL